MGRKKCARVYVIGKTLAEIDLIRDVKFYLTLR
jgi:hypothetical protein